jgi:hypothetical protein
MAASNTSYFACCCAALLQAKYAARSRHPNLTTLTLLRLYWPLLLYHSFWVLCEVGIRWDLWWL